MPFDHNSSHAYNSADGSYTCYLGIYLPAAARSCMPRVRRSDGLDGASLAPLAHHTHSPHLPLRIDASFYADTCTHAIYLYIYKRVQHTDVMRLSAPRRPRSWIAYWPRGRRRNVFVWGLTSSGTMLQPRARAACATSWELYPSVWAPGCHRSLSHTHTHTHLAMQY